MAALEHRSTEESLGALVRMWGLPKQSRLVPIGKTESVLQSEIELLVHVLD